MRNPWCGTMLLVALAMGVNSVQAQTLSVSVTPQGRFLVYGTQTLLEFSSPWVTTADYKQIYRFPGASAADMPATKEDKGEHGRWTETITPAANSVTIRYEFELADDSKMAHLEWAWRLEPKSWNGVLADAVAGRASQPIALQPLEGLRLADLKQMNFVLPDVDLAVVCRSGDGAWSFWDSRSAEWARCYRFQYMRDITPSGGRKGWFEVTIKATKAANPVVPLTTGEMTTIQHIPFQIGPARDPINKTAGTLAFLHTAGKGAARGETAGEVEVVYADGGREKVGFRGDEAFTSPTDDPRSAVNGRLATLPDNTPAWVTLWRNPRPAAAIQKLEARTLVGDWHLLAVSGTETSADPRRVASVLHGDAAPLAEQSVVSLDGIWRFSAEGIKDRDIGVPSFWDQQQGLGNVREAVYRRTFDVPDSFAGRRVSLHFDAVGDAAEVWVNGRMAGERISPALPFDVDITGLVRAASSDNQLEVRVKDDSHFSVPRNDPQPWRASRSWIPRGMGAGNRKGLYQSVSLRALPPVRIADVQIQTSVRRHELLVTYTLQNTVQDAVRVQVGASVRPATDESVAVMSLPATSVELPGYVTAQITLKTKFDGVELWQPNHPTLYMLRSLLVNGDTRLERADTRFGFREIWFEGRDFYLNGIRCNLRGESAAYGEKLEMFASRGAAAEMIRRYQKVNFNILRFHALPAPRYVLDLCDEMGMLVIDESGIYASWGMLMPEHPDWMNNCREHLTRWVHRDRNHPAVIFWSAENEGLNVTGLSPAELAEYRRIIDASDGTRPVIFEGDGAAFGASPASVKHYVSTIADLKSPGGMASGYGHDLRNDIYWATAFEQDFPLGIGEFLFPYEKPLEGKEREVCYMMGLQTRGYRLANWYDIRPYLPSYCGFLRPGGVRPGYEQVYDIIGKSFAAIAVFDRAYDELGPFPKPPTLKVGEPAQRELIIYNDEFEDETVEMEWSVRQGGKQIAGERLTKSIALGGHTQVSIRFTPGDAGELQLDLASRKGGREKFRDMHVFVAQ